MCISFKEKFFVIVRQTEDVVLGTIKKTKPALPENQRCCFTCCSSFYSANGMYCRDDNKYVTESFVCKDWCGNRDTFPYSIYNYDNICGIICFSNWNLYEIEPLEEIICTGYQTSVKSFKYIKKVNVDNFPEKIKEMLVECDGRWIEKMKHPSEKIQSIAVSKNAFYIKYIDNPSENIMREAIINNFSSIKAIENPSLSIQKLAISKSRWAIESIKNPSQEILKYQRKMWG